MRSFFLIMLIISAEHTIAADCNITAEYRCIGGRVGSIVGKGRTLEEAKNNARDRAREICGGRVDYVRFIENSATC